MNSKKYPVSRKDNLVIQELDGEVLIYDLKENKAFCLNETSALVWQSCDGKNAISDISKFLGDKLNSPASDDLVWFAIDQLKKEKLIENEAELGNHFEGMSRREVIKKIGLGSMIALPIVASMVAPVSVQAASCTNLGCICSTSMTLVANEQCNTASNMGGMVCANPEGCLVCYVLAPKSDTATGPGYCRMA